MKHNNITDANCKYPHWLFCFYTTLSLTFRSKAHFRSSRIFSPSFNIFDCLSTKSKQSWSSKFSHTEHWATIYLDYKMRNRKISSRCQDSQIHGRISNISDDSILHHFFILCSASSLGARPWPRPSVRTELSKSNHPDTCWQVKGRKVVKLQLNHL